MPHLLQLFSGTGSVGKVFEVAGWKVTSVDILTRFAPTLQMSVLHLGVGDISELVDLLWASPPFFWPGEGRGFISNQPETPELKTTFKQATSPIHQPPLTQL